MRSLVEPSFQFLQDLIEFAFVVWQLVCRLTETLNEPGQFFLEIAVVSAWEKHEESHSGLIAFEDISE